MSMSGPWTFPREASRWMDGKHSPARHGGITVGAVDRSNNEVRRLDCECGESWNYESPEYRRYLRRGGGYALLATLVGIVVTAYLTATHPEVVLYASLAVTCVGALPVAACGFHPTPRLQGRALDGLALMALGIVYMTSAAIAMSAR